MLRVVVPTVVALAAGGALAYAGIPRDEGPIHACALAYTSTDSTARAGTLRVVAEPDSCATDETALSWNREGPAGAQGRQGEAGPQGPAGQTGPAGPQGPAGETGATGPQGPAGATGGTPAAAAPTAPAASAGGAFVNTSQTDIFVKFAGIKGSSLDTRHRDWSELASFRWGVSAPLVNGQRTGRVEVQDLVFTKAPDDATSGLLGVSADGRNIPTVEVEVLRRVGDGPMTKVLSLTFTGASLAALDLKGDRGTPVEQGRLKPTTVTLTTYGRRADGTLVATGTARYTPVRP